MSAGTLDMKVNVIQGTLKGRKVCSKNGRTYFSFQGVPYAKPPLGPLRFKVAEPPECWVGVRDALIEGSSCTQFNADTKQWEGSEDCLFLNVYTPELTANAHVKPVLVYFHGGGFSFGSGSSVFHGPDFLVDEGVVVVTVNYRLGVLGFLSLDNPSAPGNVGLKDQVAALQWVQKNIAQFGGDPGNVTIAGESAGAASVHFHMLSPLSKGLFHRAIAQSGSAVCAWAIEHQPIPVAFRVGKALGFSGDQPGELLDFLRGIEDMTLVKAANEHAPTQEDKNALVHIAFRPTVEKAENVEKFLTASPIHLVENGFYHDVPYMTGVTSQEGLLLYAVQDVNSPETIARFEENFSSLVLRETRLPKNYSKKEELGKKIRQFYFDGKPLTKDTLPGLFNLFGDLIFTEGLCTTVKKMAQFNKAPVYCYVFSYDGELNFYKQFIGQSDYPGASHVDDLGYLFRVEQADLDLPSNSPAVTTRARMVKLWTNFMRTGNPTPENDSLLNVKWEPYTVSNPYYLEINDKLVMKKNMFEDRDKFWEELYKNA